MDKKYINIYQSARNSAGITQEKAAELIGVSVESLRLYEGDRRFPCNSIVAKMIELYTAPYLAVQHINFSAKEISGYLPEVAQRTLVEAVINLQKEVTDFVKLRDTLVDITYDGVITEDERPQYELILKEIDDIAGAVLSFKFIKV